MIEEHINNLSEFLTLNQSLIPNIITIIVIGFFIILAFKSSLTNLSIIGLFTLVMGLLSIIGIDSDLNILNIILEAF